MDRENESENKRCSCSKFLHSCQVKLLAVVVERPHLLGYAIASQIFTIKSLQLTLRAGIDSQTQNKHEGFLIECDEI